MFKVKYEGIDSATDKIIGAIDNEPDIPTNIVKSESKESDCAVGSRIAEDKLSEFNPDSLYWTQIPESISLNNNVDQDNDLLPVKTEAQQETKETPIGGCPWDDALKPDPDMADPFYEEYLDLGSLFPDLIPGFDMEPYELLSCPSELTSTKEDLPDINTLLAEADLSNVNPDVIEELLNIEVMDEAPFDQEQLDYSSSCVSSPGSANSTADSFSTGTPTEVAAQEYVDMDAELQHLLDLLESTNAHDLTTIKANDLISEVSSSKPVKRKLNAPDATHVAKRLKASVLAPTDQYFLKHKPGRQHSINYLKQKVDELKFTDIEGVMNGDGLMKLP
ncbi:hypothetical protein QZH41_004282 [Actinostola sp. cb2023]|nr:hypothetical protein QZH41_004282 [Actinostola sp. cb2023]